MQDSVYFQRHGERYPFIFDPGPKLHDAARLMVSNDFIFFLILLRKNLYKEKAAITKTPFDVAKNELVWRGNSK